MRVSHAIRLPLVLLITHFAIANPVSALASGSERLGQDVRPTFESLRLTLDPSKPDYRGSAHVELRVRAATDSFQFHSEGIALKRVTLRGAKGVVPATNTQAGPTVVTVRTRSPLQPGAYALDISFEGSFSTLAQGLYRVQTGGESYSFTQFESDDARKAFPCWDEPAFKIPYQLTFVVPKAHQAVSNTPIERVIPGKLTKTVIFRRTKPLPSYLLAIATGPLEMVPIPGTSVPSRVVTVKGASRLAGEAVKMATPILGALERYFGRRYPYEKLDLIAVPEFWPGAMENAGAVTFRDDLLLMEPKTASLRQRATLSSVMAHELSHMWFGDLVTMEWWDDLWLNESFASWMGNKISDEVYPEFKVSLLELRATQGAMETDATLSTRAIRQPISALDNLLQSADELAYQKGQSVLGMFEQWLGPDSFRAGVLQYLKAHEWGTAVGADLWSALSNAADKDAAGPMATFLDQGGIPIVSVDVLDGGLVKLSQRRFLNYGIVDPGAELWKVPVTLKFSDGESVRSQKVLLAGPEMTVALEGGRSPVWILPNSGEAGYYRWNVPPAMLSRLAESATEVMSPRERVGFLGNLGALLDAGIIHGDEYMRVVRRFANDPRPEVISAVLDAVAGVRATFVTPELKDSYALYVRQALAPALDRFGLERRPGEEDGVSFARASLVRRLGEDGNDARVRAHADSLANRYLSDPSSVDPSLIGVALDLSGLGGDQARFEDYKHRFETTQDPADRGRFLEALGYFRDPKIMDEALRYSLEGPLRPQEIFTIPGVVGSALEYEEVPFRWMSGNYAKIVARIPPMFAVFLPHFAEGCSVKRLEAAKAFFADATHSVAGTEKELAKVADRVNDCAGLREREGAAVSRYLSGLAGAR